MATNQNEGNGSMVKVCKFFKDFFDEEVKGKKRLTGASLKRDYGVTRNCLDNLKNGHEMFTGSMNKIGCAYLEQFPTQKERFRQVIKLLDVQREQDIENYGPDGSPFTVTFKDILDLYILEEAEKLAKTYDHKELMEKLHQQLIKDGLLLD